MLDAFEVRLVEVLTDALADVSVLAAIERPRDGLSGPDGAHVHLRVRLLDASSVTALGDDEAARLRRAGQWRRRIELRLAGEIELEFEIGAATPPQRGRQRERLIQTVDQVLVVLAEAGVRGGQAFATAEDRGFEIEGFRVVAVEAPREADVDASEGRRFRVRCAYVGTFWPVGVEEAGVAIAELPIRQAVLPVPLPTGLHVAAGGELEIPVEVELAALGIGGGSLPQMEIMARLTGTSPGALVGPAMPEAPTWHRYPAAPEDPTRFVLRYQAPASVAGKVEARIALAVASPGAGRVELGSLAVEVRG